MPESVEINGAKYKMRRGSDIIILQKYDETHKMWVNLHFPINNQEEGRHIEGKIIDVLSNQYIARTAKAQLPVNEGWSLARDN